MTKCYHHTVVNHGNVLLVTFDDDDDEWFIGKRNHSQPVWLNCGYHTNNSCPARAYSRKLKHLYHQLYRLTTVRLVWIYS